MQTSAIIIQVIPVWLSSTSQPGKEVLGYALLDSQSDTTFILSEIAGALNTKKEKVKLKLSTLPSTGVKSQHLNNLQVRGFVLV